ncbi:F0F1 ATP synthase subunit alpha (plasmid) [Paroceanicella profunda]|uniref:ATP synthase subunit alpha n=1 Tax=Paroceanicella profunda TaxID=2579971 RepID=A0A5B8G1S7_9RHOB|nr:F0F1 ATP synthase subunit alpha [Paroceanicella profunda]QDL93994.1 F0F1 ATP synthase subunit alpha [Paroceanicella profunda]
MTTDGEAPLGRSDAWLADGRSRLARAELAPEAEAIGRVEQVSDGIARVSGLPQVRLNELLRFEGNRLGFALSLDADTIGAVLLDGEEGIHAGAPVRGTGEVVRVPVGPGLLGRVVDPLGRPIDGKGPVEAASHEPVERPAPAIIERDLVAEPMETGILVVDALFALGRGQRELIVGDRATGKTSVAVDAIVNQKRSEVICVYVAVGQRATAVARVVEAVRAHGAPERCIFVVAPAATAPGLQWIAPFAGMTMAEHFRDAGQDALIVIDDLTKHAATHRELALLTREPPGREAYPGDVFYVHARLLERAAKLSAARGGGSLTALPVAETDAGNLSAYIPTNLISITDGQIVLGARLFAANQRPAVDVGLSVSRVGGKAQRKALRAVSGRVRLDYAQFLELEMFTRFGGMSDTRVKAQIARGERIRALLTQPRFAGLRMADQVALLAALADGALDSLPPARFSELRARLPGHLDTTAAAALTALGDGSGLDDGLRAALVAAVAALAADLAASPGPGDGTEGGAPGPGSGAPPSTTPPAGSAPDGGASDGSASGGSASGGSASGGSAPGGGAPGGGAPGGDEPGGSAPGGRASGGSAPGGVASGGGALGGRAPDGSTALLGTDAPHGGSAAPGTGAPPIPGEAAATGSVPVPNPARPAGADVSASPGPADAAGTSSGRVSDLPGSAR